MGKKEKSVTFVLVHVFSKQVYIYGESLEPWHPPHKTIDVDMKTFLSYNLIIYRFAQLKLFTGSRPLPHHFYSCATTYYLLPNPAAGVCRWLSLCALPSLLPSC